MRIYVDRESCLRTQAVCDLCFGRMVRREQWPDRACMVFVEDDGRDLVTFVLSAPHGYHQLELTPEMRERLSWGGIDTVL